MFTSHLYAASSGQDKPPTRLTKAEAEATRQLHAKLGGIFDKLSLGSQSFTDTIRVSNADPLPQWLVLSLERLHPGKVAYEPGKWVAFQGRDRVIYRLLPSLLYLHQPSPFICRYVCDRLPKHWISRIDRAFDQLTRTYLDADRLRDDVRQHIVVQYRRGDHVMHETDNVTYWRFQDPGRKQTGCYLALYSDKTSKPTGDPASHLDVRLFSTQTCRRQGVYSAADVIGFDPNRAVSRYIRLADIIWPKAAKLFDKEARARRRDGEDVAASKRRLLYIIGRRLTADKPNAALPTWDDLRDYPVQAVIDAAPFLRNAAIFLSPDLLIKNRPLYLW